MLVTDQAKLIRMDIQFRHLIEGGFEEHKGWTVYGRGSSGIRVFDVAKGEHIVGAALIDETEEPENEAEEAVVEGMVARDADETTPNTTAHSDKNIEGEPGG